MSAALIVVGTLLGIAVFVAAILGIIWAAFRGLARLSGWPLLAERYPAGSLPGPAGPVTTLRMGPVRFRRCVRVSATPQGLHLAGPWGLAAILVPWEEVTAVEGCRLYWFPAVRLWVGRPTVTTLEFYTGLWPAVAPYLRHLG